MANTSDAELSPTLAALKAANGGGRRRTKRLAPAGPECVIAYVRVSTEEQAASGLGLKSQEQAIREECERRGWTLCAIYSDEGVSGKISPEKRPGLAKAITALDHGEAKRLVTLKIDRISRKLAHLLVLADAATRAGWEIVTLSGTFDMSTAQGRAMASMLGAFAEIEAEMVSSRTSLALQVKKSQGFQLGKPSKVTDEARAKLAELRAEGLSWAKVAARMNELGIPSGSGEVAWRAPAALRLCPPEGAR
jgi:DNA invertase Pin-like site-specific DNA recombinase